MARRFAEAFEAQGFSVWWDQTIRSGEAYDEVTEGELRAAKAVVVLWSPRSVVSRWVRAEATLADRNRTLVPARIEPCDLPIMFELTQTAELLHWHGDTDDSAWLAFLADVRRQVDAGLTKENKGQAVQRHTEGKLPRRGGRPSLAILPFINRSELREDDIFANGMVDDLTAALSLSRQMKVLAASATAVYRKEARDLRQIGRDLAARYLLEGNVRRLGENLRVTAQLVEAETDNILWTQKFDQSLAELAALQEQLVTEVAAHLGVQVQRAEIEHALRKPGNITAWEAVLRSDAHLFRSTRAGYAAAVSEARRAVELDPQWGTTYAVLAAALAFLWQYLGGEDPELKQEALDYIQRARSYDPSSPLVLCRIAGAYRALGRPHDAHPFDQRAVELNPNLEILRMSLASNLLQLGRSEEAIAEMEEAERLAPNSPWFAGNLLIRSQGHLQAGRLDQALGLTERSIRLLAQPAALVQHAICLELANEHDRACEAIRRLRDSDPEMSPARAVRIFKGQYGATGTADRYAKIVETLWSEVAVD